jgi:hypothetical protein
VFGRRSGGTASNRKRTSGSALSAASISNSGFFSSVSRMTLPGGGAGLVVAEEDETTDLS